jgi:hypothetical protein
MPRWDQCRFHKKRVVMRYVELVFLHPVGYVGHIVHFGASGMQNVDALFFMLGWARCGFHKKCTGTRYAELVFFASGGIGHVVHSGASGRRISTHYFSCSSGPGAVSIKSVLGHITLNLCVCIRWNLWVT